MQNAANRLSAARFSWHNDAEHPGNAKDSSFECQGSDERCQSLSVMPLRPPQKARHLQGKEIAPCELPPVQEDRWKTTNQRLDCQTAFNEILIPRYSTKFVLSPNYSVLKCPPNTSAGPLDLRRNKQQNVPLSYLRPMGCPTLIMPKQLVVLQLW